MAISNKNRAAAVATTQQKRSRDVRQTFSCHHLATELQKRNFHRIDYMTIDTEGSEPDIIEDFPWNEFDVRVVQVEQLVATKYPSQKGKKEFVISHMQQYGYTLFSVFPVTPYDTDDLIFVRNISSTNHDKTSLKVSTNATDSTMTFPTQPSPRWLQQYRTEKFLQAIKGSTNAKTPNRRDRHRHRHRSSSVTTPKRLHHLAEG
jgi:hypothetical protein